MFCLAFLIVFNYQFFKRGFGIFFFCLGGNGLARGWCPLNACSLGFCVFVENSFSVNVSTLSGLGVFLE